MPPRLKSRKKIGNFSHLYSPKTDKMKNLKFVAAFLIAAMLTSCLDTEEKIVLNADNSGIYTLTIDMGRMLKMAAGMGANTDSTGVKEMKDTTINLGPLLTAANDLTAAEKLLYKEAVVHAKVDESKDEMIIVMTTPFKNSIDLVEIKNNFSTVINKSKALEKATGKKATSGLEGIDLKPDAKSTNPLGELFTFVASPGKLSNSITNMDAFKKKVATDSSLTMMRQMTAMMGDFNYRTILVLPKPVKGYDGPGSTISADKKTVTFLTTLTEMIEHPEKVSYKITY